MTFEHEDELRPRMQARQADSATGIGAAWHGNVTPSDLDGQQHLLWATDGVEERWVEVLLPREERDLPPEAIEMAVERRAGDFPAEARLQELQDRSPHRLDAGLSGDGSQAS
jgi:hypothetical protein